MPNLPFRPPPFLEQRRPPPARPVCPQPGRAAHMLRPLRRAPWFAISAAFHAVLLLLLAALSVRPVLQEEQYAGAFEVTFYQEPAERMAETVAPEAEEAPQEAEPESEPEAEPEPVPPVTAPAAVPPEDPPEVTQSFQGLSVRPWSSLTVVARNENSGVFVRPITMAPASLRFFTTGASPGAITSLKAVTPFVVAQPS